MTRARLLVATLILILSQNFSAHSAVVYQLIDGKFVNVLTGKDLDAARKQARNLPVCLSGIDSQARREFCPTVVSEAEKYGIQPALLEALVLCESAYKTAAVSSRGAFGLTQLMEETADELGVDRRSPKDNIHGGARYLAQQYSRFKDWSLALAAYNAGGGAVSRHEGIPPYRETIDYVSKVQRTAKHARIGDCSI